MPDNPASKAEIRKTFIEILVGFSVNVEGVISSHGETLTKEGAEALWDRITTRGLKIMRDE